jgi:hypothetical protein
VDGEERVGGVIEQIFLVRPELVEGRLSSRPAAENEERRCDRLGANGVVFRD